MVGSGSLSLVVMQKSHMVGGLIVFDLNLSDVVVGSVQIAVSQV